MRLLKQVCEEFAHALLVAVVFEIHVGHERPRLSVSIRTLQQHPQVVDAADVIFSDIDDETGLRLLLNGDFAAFLLGSDLDAGFRDHNLLLV